MAGVDDFLRLHLLSVIRDDRVPLHVGHRQTGIDVHAPRERGEELDGVELRLSGIHEREGNVKGECRPPFEFDPQPQGTRRDRLRFQPLRTFARVENGGQTRVVT